MDGVRRQTQDRSIHRRRCVRLANVCGVMIAAWILTGASFLMTAAALYVAYRWREAYFQAYGLFKKYHGFIKNGARDFLVAPEFVDNDFNVGKVHVEATDGEGLSLVVKTFIVDNPYDKEDVAFAVREAKELIETIQKA